MSKSTEVHIVADGIELKYAGSAGKQLMSSQVFYSRLSMDEDQYHADWWRVLTDAHDPISVIYDGQTEVLSLMMHTDFLDTLMSCMGIHNSSYVLGILQTCLDQIDEGNVDNAHISVTFTVYC